MAVILAGILERQGESEVHAKVLFIEVGHVVDKGQGTSRVDEPNVGGIADAVNGRRQNAVKRGIGGGEVLVGDVADLEFSRLV